jgi:hypothetical protein
MEDNQNRNTGVMEDWSIGERKEPKEDEKLIPIQNT